MAVYWGVRSERDLYAQALLEELIGRAQARRAQAAQSAPAQRYVPVLSEPTPEWRGRRGLVHEAVLEDIDDLTRIRCIRSRAARHDCGRAPRFCRARSRRSSPVLRFLRLRAGFPGTPAQQRRHQILIFGRVGLQQRRRTVRARAVPRRRARREPARVCARIPGARRAAAISSKLAPISTLVAVITCTAPAAKLATQRLEGICDSERSARARKLRQPAPPRRGSRARARAMDGRRLPLTRSMRRPAGCSRSGLRSRPSESKLAGRLHRHPIARLIQRARGRGARSPPASDRASDRAARRRSAPRWRW